MDWAEVRTMDAEGISRRQIAMRLGIDPRTVKRLAEAEEPPSNRRAPAGSMLDPLESLIAELIGKWPEIKAPRVTEILRDEHDYQGSVVLRALGHLFENPTAHLVLGLISSPSETDATRDQKAIGRSGTSHAMPP